MISEPLRPKVQHGIRTDNKGAGNKADNGTDNGVQRLRQKTERQKLDGGHKDNADLFKKKGDKSGSTVNLTDSYRTVVSDLVQPDETQAKQIIAQDVLNDENEHIELIKPDEDVFVFPDDTEDAALYKLDYSNSHPFVTASVVCFLNSFLGKRMPLSGS